MRSRGLGAAHDERRADIIAAVRAISAEHGITAVSQSAVAAAAGVSTGRVQHYFATKEALLDATFAELNAAASARIVELVGQPLATAEPRQVLETVLTELIPHDPISRAHVQFRQAYTALALHHGAVAARLRDHYRRLHHEQLAGLIARDRRRRLIRTAERSVDIAVRLAALAEGLAYYVLIDASTPDAARQLLVREIGRLYA